MSPPTTRQLARNIRRTLAFSFLQVFMVLMPVIVLFFGQGIDVVWFGCLWGALTLVSAAAGKYALQLEDRLVSAMFFACRGFGTVVLRQALNRRVPSTFRATANSFASLGFRGGFALTAPVVGIALDPWGMETTFVLLAVASLGICLGLLAPLVLAVRGMSHAPPDQEPTHSSHQPCGEAVASSSVAAAEPSR